MLTVRPPSGMMSGMSTTDEAPKVGPRTWLYAVLAALSTSEPELVLRIGPLIAVLVVLTGNPGRFRVGFTVVFGSGYALWAVWTSTWALNPSTALQSGLAVGAVVAIFFGAIDLIKSVPQLRVVAGGFLAGAFLAVVQVLVQNRGGLGTGERLSLEGLNQNYLGYSLATAFAMLVLLWVTGRGAQRRRFWLIIAALGLGVGVEVTDTRGAYLGVAFLAVWLIVSKLATRPPLWALVTSVVAASFVIVSGFWDERLASLEFGDRATGDWSGRLYLWPTARLMWGENLWRGVGSGGFAEASRYEIGAHNVFLQLGVGLGIVGVALFVAVWVSSLRPAAKAGPQAALLVGAFLAASAPAYLTGYWETAPAAWIALAVFARVEVLRQIDWTAPAPEKSPAESARRSRPLVHGHVPRAQRLSDGVR